MLNIGFKLWFVLEMKNSFILTYYSQYVNLILFKIAVVTSGCSPEPRYMGNIVGRKKNFIINYNGYFFILADK